MKDNSMWWIITAIIAFLIVIGAIPVGFFTFFFLGMSAKVIFVILLIGALVFLFLRRTR